MDEQIIIFALLGFVFAFAYAINKSDRTVTNSINWNGPTQKAEAQVVTTKSFELSKQNIAVVALLLVGAGLLAISTGGSKLAVSNWNGSVLPGAQFGVSNWNGSTGSDAKFGVSNWNGSVLPGAKFSVSNWNGSVLPGAKFSVSNWNGSVGPDAKFSVSNWNGSPDVSNWNG